MGSPLIFLPGQRRPSARKLGAALQQQQESIDGLLHQLALMRACLFVAVAKLGGTLTIPDTELTQTMESGGKLAASVTDHDTTFTALLPATPDEPPTP